MSVRQPEPSWEEMARFWENVAIGLKEEMIQRGDRVEELEAALATAQAGTWQPVAHDDPNNDGPVWVDENGCVCWAGANGEVRRLVLHGDMRLCLWVEGAALLQIGKGTESSDWTLT